MLSRTAGSGMAVVLLLIVYRFVSGSKFGAGWKGHPQGYFVRFRKEVVFSLVKIDVGVAPSCFDDGGVSAEGGTDASHVRYHGDAFGFDSELAVFRSILGRYVMRFGAFAECFLQEFDSRYHRLMVLMLYVNIAGGAAVHLPAVSGMTPFAEENPRRADRKGQSLRF